MPYKDKEKQNEANRRSRAKPENKAKLSEYNKRRRPEIQKQLKEYKQTERGRAKQREYAREYRKRSGKRTVEADPKKLRARQLVYNAVRRGDLVRQPCQYMGCSHPKSQAHHKDYDKPLEVEWYCPPHHKLKDKEVNTNVEDGTVG